MNRVSLFERLMGEFSIAFPLEASQGMSCSTSERTEMGRFIEYILHLEKRL